MDVQNLVKTPAQSEEVANKKCNVQDLAMTKVIKILDDARHVAVDEEDSCPQDIVIQNYFTRFSEIYCDSEFRHSYALISNCLDGYKAEELDSLAQFVNRVVEYANVHVTDENRHIYKSMVKLLDHLELECIRLNRMSQVRYFAEQMSEQQAQASQEQEQVKQLSEEASQKVLKIHEQSISILGIFAAIVIAFASQISIFGKGLENVTSVNVYAILFYVLVVGIVSYNTIFMLLFCISKICGSSIATCEHPACVWWKRPFVKYTYIISFNVISVILVCMMFYRMR